MRRLILFSSVMLLSLGTALQPAAAASTHAVVETSYAAPVEQMGTTREIARVKSVRPTLAAAVNAIKQGDLAAGKAGVWAFDAGWNGIEYYVLPRSDTLYRELEVDAMFKLEELLDGPQPNAADAVVLAEKLLAKYDEAIRLVEAGPPLNARYDEVGTVRIIRAHLREVPRLLKANDLGSAKASYFRFRIGWPEAEGAMKTYSEDAHRAVTESLPKVDAAFESASATVADLAPLADALLQQYNVGLNAVNAAAKEAEEASKKPN